MIVRKYSKVNKYFYVDDQLKLFSNQNQGKIMSEAHYDKMSDSEKKKEDWMNNKWRPAMGWLYMLVCLCDFVLFPVLWSLLHAIMHSANMTQWQPLTLQGAGLFHIAMGAILGIAALGRTQEKLAGANNGGAPIPGMPPSSPGMGMGGFGAPSPMAPPSVGVPGVPPRPSVAPPPIAPPPAF